MLIAWHLCNYLKVNFGNLLAGENLKFNNDLMSHHQLVVISINVHVESHDSMFRLLKKLYWIFFLLIYRGVFGTFRNTFIWWEQFVIRVEIFIE
jgi:hypothetical protein